ncbi:MAG: AsmA-like C-terminal domain-containing protein [Alphaproteobacteria bacterium]|nr:AsmA-like C-terminal domain-containing protein [Alphaproteobacteria bacterium]
MRVRGITGALLTAFGGLATVLSVALLWFGWRITEAPLSIRPLMPLLLSEAAGWLPGRTLEVADLDLVWDREDWVLAVRAQDVRVLGGASPLQLGEMTVALSVEALLRGRLAPVEVSVDHLQLTVERTADGVRVVGATLRGAESSEARAAPTAADAETALERWLQPPDGDPNDPISFLRRVRLIAPEVTVMDRLAGPNRPERWQISLREVTLDRDRQGLVVQAGGRLSAGDLGFDLNAAARWRSGADVVDLEVSAPTVEPLRLAGLFVPEQLPTLSMPVAITARAAVALTGAVVTAQATVSAGAGTVVDDRLPRGRLSISTLRIALAKEADDTIRVTEGIVTSEAMRLSLSGQGRQGPDGRYHLGGAAVVEGMAMAELPAWWPAMMAPNPRQWILANITEGTARRAAVEFAVSTHDFEDFDVERLSGTFDYAGLKVTYLPGLLPAEQVTGVGRFDANIMHLDIASGVVRRLRLDEARIVIDGLSARDQTIDIQVAARGPVAEVLSLVDAPRFRYAQKVGITPAGSAGDVVARLRFQFPLLNALKIDDVKLSIGGTVTGLRLPRIVRGQDLTDGRLRIDLDGGGLVASGTASLAGIASRFDWVEMFNDRAPFRRRFEVQASLSDADRRRLDLGLDDVVRGAVPIDVELIEYDGGRAQLLLRADLTAAQMAIEPLLWSKPAGITASASAEAMVQGGRLASLPGFRLDGGGLVAAGSATADRDGNLTRIDIARLRLGESDARVQIDRSQAVPVITIDARRFDLSPWRDDPSPPAPPGQGPSLRLVLRTPEVLIGKGAPALPLDAAVTLDRGRWREARLTLGSGGNALQMQITPTPTRRRLSLTASDAGLALMLLGQGEAASGGVLKLDGVFDDSNPASPLDGTLSISALQIRRAPALLQLLQLASVTGIPEFLSGGGIAFDRVEASFRRVGERLEVSEAVLAGASLGISFEGTIDGPESRAQLTGVLRPFNAVNRLIGAIPLLGQVLTDGGRGGIGAFNFSVSGPLDEPSVSVNPLSALAPGPLRRLFEAADPSRPPQPRTLPSSDDR